MFNKAVMQSEDVFAAEGKEMSCYSAKRKGEVTKLRSFLREQLVEADFKAIVTRLAEKRKEVDQTYKYI